MKAARCKVSSPSVLKVLSLATSAMALRAMSERWGASKREIADRQWHLASSACWRRVRLKGLRICRQKLSKKLNFLISAYFPCWTFQRSDVDPIWNQWHVRNNYTYQDTAIWQCGHVIDHNLFQWGTSSRDVFEPIYCHLGRVRGKDLSTLESESFWTRFPLTPHISRAP